MISSSRGEALGQSEVFLDFQERLSRVAPVDRPVLLIGERGTGKELAASRLHFMSKRWEGSLDRKQNDQRLSPWLTKAQVKSLWDRRNKILERADKLVKSTEDAVLF